VSLARTKPTLKLLFHRAVQLLTTRLRSKKRLLAAQHQSLSKRRLTESFRAPIACMPQLRFRIRSNADIFNVRRNSRGNPHAVWGWTNSAPTTDERISLTFVTGTMIQTSRIVSS
jgi:hypothetical protein